MHIESEETNFPQNLPPQYKEEDKQVGTRLTLLSDAYISNTLLKNCHLVFCETQDARFLQTSSSTTQPNNMSIDRKNPKAAYKTKRYSVLERGSVLYVKNLKEVINELDKTRLKQIGYNYYIIE